MKKNKEWLKEEIKKLITEESQYMPHGEMVDLELVLLTADQLDELEVKQLDKKIRGLESYNDELIRDNNQLRNVMDNQEVLSQKWMDEHTYNHYIGRPFVYVNDLQNLLVPKQDKPVIPKFVANFIRATKPNNSLRLAFEYIAQQKIDNYDDGLAFWIEEGNSELFARAWMDGYEVEKEKKYRVVLPSTVWDEDASELKENTMFLALDITSGETRFSRPFPSAGKNGDYRTYLTESQIKAIDERYWAFAQEVTE